MRANIYASYDRGERRGCPLLPAPAFTAVVLAIAAEISRHMSFHAAWLGFFTTELSSLDDFYLGRYQAILRGIPRRPIFPWGENNPSQDTESQESESQVTESLAPSLS
jgi:hypothetical protein